MSTSLAPGLVGLVKGFSYQIIVTLAVGPHDRNTGSEEDDPLSKTSWGVDFDKYNFYCEFDITYSFIMD